MRQKNVIPDRIAEALRRFPPFSMLPAEEITLLAQGASVMVLASGDRVWSQGDRPGAELLFLARGRVEYLWNHDGQNERVDVRDVGDVLGLTALLQDEPFRVTAQVVEDSLFYCLEWRRLRELLDAHDTARHYVRRHLFWATRVGGTVAATEAASPPDCEDPVAGRAKNILQAHLDGARRVEVRPAERLLRCAPGDTIHHAASLMSQHRVPSIIVVDPEQHPVGIVTNSDLVRHVVVDGMDREAKVSSVMAKPVVTVSPNSSATAAILVMLRERIGQVCVTEDGTPDTRALDVCTHKDLLMQTGHHPAGLLREFAAARSSARFRELCDDVEAIARSYLAAGVSAVFLGQMCAELYDELVQRLLALSIEELATQGVLLPDVPWAWVSVGSDGRREQILRTDMDNAFLFGASGVPEKDEAARTAFLRITNRVVERLVECGFARCQGGVMASNPRWCRTVDEWTHEIDNLDQTSGGDELLRALVLFDLRHVAGEKALCARVRNHVFDAVGASPRLQREMAAVVVDTPPPLNFWGKFVVERRGSGGEGEFDIKQRAMAPLREAARLLCLRHGLRRRYSTGGRWEDLQRQVPRLAELAGLAREGFDLLLRLRTQHGLRRGDSGRFIEPSALSKLERSQLANVFDVVRMVQTSVRLEFQLTGPR